LCPDIGFENAHVVQDGSTALIFAVKTNNIFITDLLLKKGAQVDATGKVKIKMNTILRVNAVVLN
jgi:ankyrin repeat protein